MRITVRAITSVNRRQHPNILHSVRHGPPCEERRRDHQPGQLELSPPRPTPLVASPRRPRPRTSQDRMGAAAILPALETQGEIEMGVCAFKLGCRCRGGRAMRPAVD